MKVWCGWSVSAYGRIKSDFTIISNPYIWIEELKKITKTLSKGSWDPGRYSKEYIPFTGL
jgi:hypothetical protein